MLKKQISNSFELYDIRRKKHAVGKVHKHYSCNLIQKSGIMELSTKIRLLLHEMMQKTTSKPNKLVLH